MKPLRKGAQPAFTQPELPFDEIERLSRQWVGKDVIYGRLVARVIGFQWYSDSILRALKSPPLLHVSLLPLRWRGIANHVKRPWRRDPLTGVSGPIQGPWTIREIRPAAKVFTLHSRHLDHIETAPQK